MVRKFEAKRDYVLAQQLMAKVINLKKKKEEEKEGRKKGRTDGRGKKDPRGPPLSYYIPNLPLLSVTNDRIMP